MELKSVDELYFYERAKLWKRAAKKWRDKYNNPVQLSEWQELQADADSRLELLREYNDGLQHEPDCFSCGIMTFNEDTEKWEHADGCELAKELSDE